MSLAISLTLRRRLTALIWLVGLLLAMFLIARGPVRQIRGLARVDPVILAASEDGLLIELDVALHQLVSAGDVVARLDPGLLTARVSVLEAELESLHQKESSAEQGRSRRFEKDREAAALELAKLSATVEEGQARARVLREELAIEERLVTDGVAAAEKAGGVRRELEVVEARLAADRERLRLARRGVARSGARAETAEGPNQWQIVMARRRLAELDGRLDRLVLRSPAAGQVTQVFRAAGEWLEAGDPILRISPMAAREVHAWLDWQAGPQTLAGRSAEVRRATGERWVGTVASVGVERLQLPEELWMRADAPEWGYLARIELAEGALAPGEPVQVALRGLDDRPTLVAAEPVSAIEPPPAPGTN